MERFFCVAMSIVVLLQFFGCRGVQQKPENTVKFYHLADIAAKPGELRRVLKGVDSGRQVMLKIDKGTQLPLQINLAAPLIRLGDKQAIIRISVVQDFYILLSGKGAKLSLDGKSWTATKDLDSVKSLLGIHRAVFEVSLAPHESSSALFVLEISTE